MYKFTQTPTTPEKESPKRQIMPPAPKLRQSSSMLGLDSVPNGSFQNSSKVSQSTLNLNGAIVFESQKIEGTKLKQKKWYSMFLPPHKEKVKLQGIENEPLKEKKEKKRKWYKSKKKEKIAVQ